MSNAAASRGTKNGEYFCDFPSSVSSDMLLWPCKIFKTHLASLKGHQKSHFRAVCVGALTSSLCPVCWKRCSEYAQDNARGLTGVKKKKKKKLGLGFFPSMKQETTRLEKHVLYAYGVKAPGDH